MKRLLLLIVSVVLIADEAWAFDIKGSVNASEIPDNAEVFIKGNTTLFMDVNKTIKSIGSQEHSLTINGGNILTINNTKEGKTGMLGRNITINAPVHITTNGQTISDQGKLTINGNLTSRRIAPGNVITAERGVVISSGNVVLQGSCNNGNYDYAAIYSSTEAIDIKGGNVVITFDGKTAYGILNHNTISIDGNANVTVTASNGMKGGTVNMNGGSTKITSIGNAIYGTYVYINGGSLNATSSNANGIEAELEMTINKSNVKVQAGIMSGTHYGIHCQNGHIDIANSTVDVNAKGSGSSAIHTEGGPWTIHLTNCGVIIPSGGFVWGVNIANSSKEIAKKVYIGKAITGQVALASTPIVGEQVDITLSGEVAVVSDVSYKWQISDDGTSWSDISGAISKSYTPKASDLGKYIRVRVVAAELTGGLVSAGRIVEKSNCHTPVVAPTLAIVNNKVRVSNAKAVQEYIMLSSHKAISNLTENDWSGATSPAADGNLDMGGSTGLTYYVYTRVKETNSTKAGTDVECSSIYSGTTTNVQGFKMQVRLQKQEGGTKPTYYPIENKENGAYYVNRGDVIRIDVEAMPSDASFAGISGSRWYSNSGGGNFYSDFRCTTPISSSENYKTVYFRTTEQKNFVDVNAEYTKGYNDVVREMFYLHVASESGYVLMDRIDPVSVTLGTGEIQSGIDLITHPGKASVSDLHILIADALSSPPPFPTVTFNKETRQLSVDASGVNEGTYYYSVYQGGTKMSNRITVNVMGIPCEGISFDPAFIEMEPGEMVTVSPQLQPANSTVPVTWTSSSTDVTVSNGMVTVSSSAPRGSYYTITATAGGFHADMDIYVPKLPAELAFGTYEPLVYVGDAFTPPTLENPHGLTVSYFSSDETVATVNSSTGEVTLVGEGVVKITASASSNSDYDGDDISYDIVVEKHSADLDFSLTEVTAKMGEVFTAPTLTNPNGLTVTWSSSNEAVATVNASTGEVTLTAPGTTTITATFIGNDSYVAGSASYTLTVNKKDAMANGLAISATEVTAKIGETFTAPTLTNPNSLTVTWSSSNEAVATVNASTGEVMLVADGTATITATFEGNDDFVAGSVSYTLTVNKKDPVANGLDISSTEATAKMSMDFTSPTFVNPNNLTVTWSSSNEAVATVNASTGEVTLVAAGIATITATFAGNDDFVAGSVSYTLTVNKKDVVANDLSFSISQVTAKMGEMFTPPTLMNPNNLTVTWLSTNETVAMVNPVTGEVTIVGPGVTTIEAAFAGNDDFVAGNVSYDLIVEKKDAVANELSFSVSEAKAKIGEAFTPPTLYNPNNLTVIWSSSDETVATVDPVTGDVTLVAPGFTSITAFFAGSDDYLAGSVGYKLTVEEKTAIIGVEMSGDDTAKWYDMQGHKLSGKPKQKGVYLRNGCKVVVR